MRRYYISPACPNCSYLMKAVYLVNQHLGLDAIFPVFIESGQIDYETRVILSRIFGKPLAHTPVLFVDDNVFYYYGLPPWKELYATLMTLLYKDWR